MTAECINPRASEAGWTLAFCTCLRCKRRRTPYVIIKAATDRGVAEGELLASLATPTKETH